MALGVCSWSLQVKSVAELKRLLDELGVGVTQIACGDPHHASWDEGEAMAERSPAEIVRGLEVTWQLIESRLAAWNSTDLEKQFQRPTPNDAGERPRFTRQWIIWHVLEHDLHHGGEISFSLGMHGLKGIDL